MRGAYMAIGRIDGVTASLLTTPIGQRDNGGTMRRRTREPVSQSAALIYGEILSTTHFSTEGFDRKCASDPREPGLF